MAAVPYISAVVRSLRDHWLDFAAKKSLAANLDNRPGRPDRSLLIAKAEALREAGEAESRFLSAHDELASLDIFCVEPTRGEAFVPFVYDNQLAWFVFDLFDAKQYRYWRYHTDTLETRRPVSEVLTPPARSA
jgi:hypothetical protein